MASKVCVAMADSSGPKDRKGSIVDGLKSPGAALGTTLVGVIDLFPGCQRMLSGRFKRAS